jgi:LysR family hydrogen peroxide-inducible transcriptional activator
MATLTQLEYLIAVDRYRHFGKAAKACHVSQPTLSMQLQKLEEEFEMHFFDRTKQPILPTPLAIPVIEQAKIILRENEKLKHLAHLHEGEITGDFHLSVIPTVAPYLLHRFLGHVSQKHPKLNLVISEKTTAQIIEALDHDEIDAGILATPLDHSSLDERPLYYEPFHVFASKNHPLIREKNLTEEKLPVNDIWLLSEGHCLRNQMMRLCSIRKTSAVIQNLKFESGSLETIIHLIEQGHGYTLLPALAAERLIREKNPLLKEFKGDIPTREISMVYQRSQYKQNILKAISEAIKHCLPPGIVSPRRTPEMSILKVKNQ